MDKLNVPDQKLMAGWVLPVDQSPIRHGFVQIERNLITEVGRISDLPEAEKADYHWQNQYLITPGLINTHTHLELTFPAEVSAEGGMVAWLRRVVALQRASSKQDCQARVQTGIQQVICSGTTTVNDISRDGACLSALKQAGLRAQVALEFFNPSAEVSGFSNLEALWSSAKMAETALITLGLSPHSPYNVHPAAWKQGIKTCQPAFIHTHVAESLAEQAWVQGKTPNGIDVLHQTFLHQVFPVAQPACSVVSYLAENGILDLDIPTRVAHALFCNPADIARLSRAGWGVLHCPRSNVYLQGETLTWPLWEHYPAGIGLGTDSTLSAPNLDIRAEARVAQQCHGWSAEETLRRLTLSGAKALEAADTLGSLTPGQYADWVVWRANVENEQQAVDPYSLCLSETTQAVSVGVAGNIIYSRLV